MLMGKMAAVNSQHLGAAVVVAVVVIISMNVNIGARNANAVTTEQLEEGWRERGTATRDGRNSEENI